MELHGECQGDGAAPPVAGPTVRGRSQRSPCYHIPEEEIEILQTENSELKVEVISEY